MWTPTLPKRLFLLCLLFCGLGQACVPPEGDSQNAPLLNNETLQNLGKGFQEVSTEFQELSRPSKVEAWVDNLIVKSQPGKDMPQVATLSEGEVATYLYQRTVRKSEFRLRQQRYYEPWILIQTQTGIMGWVHEGGVRYLSPSLEQLLGGGGNSQPGARTRGPQAPAANPSQDFLVVPGKQVGPIRLKTSETDLIRIYGPANVSRGEVQTAAGQTEPCTIVLGGTHDELKVTWKDDTRAAIKAVYLHKPQGRWITPQGLQVGMGLMALTKANKAPVSFYGFNWTYGGTVSGWRQGALAPYDKHFYVILTPASNVPPSLVKPFTGNKVFTSNEAGIEQLNIEVARIGVYLD